MRELVTLAVEPEDAGKRADVFVAENLEDTSRAMVQKRMEQGLVQKDGSPVRANLRLKAGDVLTVELPEPEPLEIAPENIPLDVVYEDGDLLVVNKPQGMVVHPAAGHTGGTLVNALLYHCGDSLSGINGVLRPGIVHRIDKDTSGLLVVAKNDAAHAGLARQLAEHSMTRRYRAVALGYFQEAEGTVDAPLGRSPKDRKKMAIVREGKRAVTHYRVLERLRGYSLVECRLETGRTHQIRVHLASLGHPLLGDVVYGSQKQPLGLTGQVLHAMVLGFCHPRTGEYMEFSAPLPESFERVLQKLRG